MDDVPMHAHELDLQLAQLGLVALSPDWRIGRAPCLGHRLRPPLPRASGAAIGGGILPQVGAAVQRPAQ
jgi:hypothetical protein